MLQADNLLVNCTTVGNTELGIDQNWAEQCKSNNRITCGWHHIDTIWLVEFCFLYLWILDKSIRFLISLLSIIIQISIRNEDFICMLEAIVATRHHQNYRLILDQMGPVDKWDEFPPSIARESEHIVIVNCWDGTSSSIRSNVIFEK